MSNVWFISDIHAGHRNVTKWRPFNNEEEHFQHIKENYHKVVTKRDLVFFLGDIAFNKERLLDIMQWTAAKKVLVVGNHDTEHIWMRDLAFTFNEVHSLVKYKEFWLSHAPIHPDELRGKINIHGHCHQHIVDDDRYVNVCLEHTNYGPIDLQTIRKRLYVKEA